MPDKDLKIDQKQTWEDSIGGIVGEDLRAALKAFRDDPSDQGALLLKFSQNNSYYAKQLLESYRSKYGEDHSELKQAISGKITTESKTAKLKTKKMKKSFDEAAYKDQIISAIEDQPENREEIVEEVVIKDQPTLVPVSEEVELIEAPDSETLLESPEVMEERSSAPIAESPVEVNDDALMVQTDVSPSEVFDHEVKLREEEMQASHQDSNKGRYAVATTAYLLLVLSIPFVMYSFRNSSYGSEVIASIHSNKETKVNVQSAVMGVSEEKLVSFNDPNYDYQFKYLNNWKLTPAKSSFKVENLESSSSAEFEITDLSLRVKYNNGKSDESKKELQNIVTIIMRSYTHSKLN